MPKMGTFLSFQFYQGTRSFLCQLMQPGNRDSSPLGAVEDQ